MKRFALALTVAALLGSGCSSDPAQPKAPAASLATNDTPAGAASRLVNSYQQKNQDAFAGMLTGDFRFEFSSATDPGLVLQYPTGWGRLDETESSSHLFSGFPPGKPAAPAASSIVITLADSLPADDNSAGVDASTHKVLDTRVDGSVTIPETVGQPLTYVITDNEEVFYFVRGDAAAGLDSTQVADDQHWYLYRWVDRSQSFLPRPNSKAAVLAKATTWGNIKAVYR
jgi:hypothetical protein